MEVLPDLSRQTMEAAAMEGLRQQAVVMNSAVEESKDAVARDQSLRILSRRRAELDEAYDSYRLAFQCYRRVADRGSCSFSTALAARHLILGFWDKAMGELEARLEVKEEENVGVEQDEDQFSTDEDDVEDRAIRSHDVDQAEVEVGCAKDDVLLGGGALDPGEDDQSDAKDELECGAAKDDFLLGGGALDPGKGDCEIGAKVKVEVTCIGKVVKEIRVAQVQVEKIYVYKVRAEEFANLEVLRGGQVDPGEVRGNWKEAQWLVQQYGVNQELDEGWHSVGLQRHDFLGHGTEFELQGPEMELRFVSWVSGSLTMNSDFG